MTPTFFFENFVEDGVARASIWVTEFAEETSDALALGDEVVPIWRTLKERRHLGRLGAYGGVDYVVDRITENDEDLFAATSNATLWLRPRYRLIPRLERRWPVPVPASALQFSLKPRDYTIFAAVSTALAALGALAVAAFVSANIFAFSVVPSFSMAPFIQPGDVLLVDKLSTKLQSRRIGDVVFFTPPPQLDAILDHRDDHRRLFVKRVAAVPGDKVHVDGTTLAVTVNGKDIPRSTASSDDVAVCVDDENFQEVKKLWRAFHSLQTKKDEDLVVPEKSLYVLGDCPAVSVDSRVWGPLPFANVVGKDAMTLYHPPPPSASSSK